MVGAEAETQYVHTHTQVVRTEARKEREVQTIHVETFRDNDDDGEDGVKGSL